PGLAEGLRDPRLVADVCKSAVAIVVEQPARHSVVDAWDAVVALAVLRVAAKLVLGLVEIHKPANKEVKFSVVVVVKPDGTRCPALGGQASFPGHIGKLAVAVDQESWPAHQGLGKIGRAHV